MSPEYISVPVPSDRVQEVYELLARPRPSTDSPTVQPVTAKPLPWSEEILLRAYEESPDRMKLVLDTLAERPDQTVTMEELASALQIKRGQVAGVLGAFGHRWKNRYRQGEANWPFRAYWSNDVGMMVYSMDGQVAAILGRARRS